MQLIVFQVMMYDNISEHLVNFWNVCSFINIFNNLSSQNFYVTMRGKT